MGRRETLYLREMWNGKKGEEEMCNDVGALIMKEYNLLHWVFAYIHVGIGAINGKFGR